MAADTRAAQCAHRNLDLSAQEPGPSRNAENYGVSQPTISRAISAITPLLVQALLDYVPTADELDVGTCSQADSYCAVALTCRLQVRGTVLATLALPRYLGL